MPAFTPRLDLPSWSCGAMPMSLTTAASVRADGLIVQMWKIFEDFVTTALGEALRRHGGRVRQQDPRHHLDVGRAFQLRPDLVYDRPE